MGSLFKLPVLVAADTLDMLAQLSLLGIQCLGLAVDGDRPLSQADFSEQGTAVVLGSEARGLDEALCDALDGTVSIPMRSGVDSYSVNAAAAIVLYEISRQRTAAGGKRA